jgi:hypothetical protein
LTSSERTKLVASFRELDRTGLVSAALRGAAAALGAEVPDACALAEIDPREVPADAVRRLLAHDDPAFCTRVVVDGRGPELAREAGARAERLLPLPERALVAADVCREAADELSGATGDAVGPTAERLANRVGRIRLLVPDGATPALIGAVLMLIDTIEHKRSTDKQLARLRDAAESAIHLPDANIAPLIDALRLDVTARLTDETLAAAWAGSELTERSTRLAWLRALGAARPSVLDRPRAWRRVGIVDLQSLAGADETRRWLFETAAGRNRLGSLFDSILRSLDRPGLGRLIAGDSEILRRLPSDTLRTSLERLTGEDPSLEMLVGALAAPALDALADRHDDERRELDERHAAALRDAEQRQAELERRAEERASEAELARRLVQGASAGRAGEAEIGQAHLDGLRVAADVLAEIERAAGRSPTVGRVGPRLRRIAEAAGVRRVGRVGEVVRHDPTVHRVVDGEVVPGVSSVRVVEAAWVVDEPRGVSSYRCQTAFWVSQSCARWARSLLKSRPRSTRESRMGATSSWVASAVSVMSLWRRRWRIWGPLGIVGGLVMTL